MTPGPSGVVFRDAHRVVSAPELATEIERMLLQATETSALSSAPFEALEAVAGYEGALADGGEDVAAREDVAALTDRIAEAIVRREAVWGAVAPQVARAFRRRPSPRACVVKRAEGFAYYGLRPEGVVRGLPDFREGAAIVVVGIRTIGTSLSALCAAALRARDPAAGVRRATVRPSGPPYDRRVEVRSADDRAAWRVIRAGVAKDAQFLVVDEGPGLSGSSFLAVAEWLEACGARAETITLYGSHVPDPSRLCAREAARRWRRFRSAAFARAAEPGDELAGGRWRALLAVPAADWPVTTPLTDREKRLIVQADGRRRVDRFEGLGGYGRGCAARVAALAEAGFGPPILSIDPAQGVVGTALIEGRRPRASAWDRWARRIAAYCAWRAEGDAFTAADDPNAVSMLREASARNAAQELGAALKLDSLRVHRAVITDGHVQPWEWVSAPDGRLLKTDASGHGDDHFLPGPTDIAWDLAGVIVEWRLDEARRDDFLARVGQLTGDRDLARVRAFEVAYASFAAAQLTMAEGQTAEVEWPRLRRRRARLRARGRFALARLPG